MTTPTGGNTNRIALFLLILAGIGFPTAFGVGYQATQNPVQALAIMLVYGIVVGVIGFLTKVWQRLEGRWVERVADTIDASILSISAKYHPHYCQYIRYKYRTFDVKGLSTQGPHSLELEQVFVQLSVASSSRVSPNPIELPKELAQGSHSIWEYLKSPSMPNIAIIGAPGSGKTTLLKHMALTLTGNRKQRRNSGAPDSLPILIFLRDHAEAIQQNSLIKLSELIANQLGRVDISA